MFDIAVEEDDDSRKGKRRRPDGGPTDDRRPSNAKRQAKDKKYGFGGKKRFSKSGDTVSSSDMRGFSTARMKGKTGGKNAKIRPGKSKRAKGRM
jgi:rRNA-processing protein EBP2